jgi:hypothetical protein
MFGKIICWFGIHKYVSTEVAHSYKCERCGDFTGGHV